MAEYRHSAHAVFDLKYHMIWCTKYRYKILRGRVAERSRAPAKLAQYIKGRSSRHLQAEFPELRKRYWGQHMWARGYFCATVGAVDESTIKAYIENQSGTMTMRISRLQRPPSLEPALSRSSLQTASAVTTTFSRKRFYRLSAGSF